MSSALSLKFHILKTAFRLSSDILKLLSLFILIAFCSIVPAHSSTFEIVQLPDTQFYSADSYWGDDDRNIFPASNLSANFYNQTEWIAANKNAKNIVFVTHTGDIVDDGYNTSMWNTARAAMNTLNGVVPYSVCFGNHDLANGGGEGNCQSYFGNIASQGGSTYRGSFEGLNFYQAFSAGGCNILHLNLQFAPGDDVLQWAQSIIDQNPNKSVIISTHNYLEYDGVRTDIGDQIWDGLVKNNPQVFLVLCGHNHGPVTTPGVASTTSLNSVGTSVLQVITDYQNFYGGEGYLREILFNTGANGIGSIAFQSYSPTLNNVRSEDGFSTSARFGSFVHIGEPLSKVWQGGNTNQWNLTSTNSDWVATATSPGSYLQDAAVVFDNTALSRTINVTAKVTPFQMTVDNALGHDYFIQSSDDGLLGTIQCLGKLVKQGAGKLTLSGKNAFDEGIDLQGGVLEVLGNLDLGGAINVADGAGIIFGTPYEEDRSYSVSGSHAKTISEDLAGGGGLEKHGNGVLILSGNNTYLGKTTIFAGILQMTNEFITEGEVFVADGAGIVFGTPYKTSSAPESISSGVTQDLCDSTRTSGHVGSGTKDEIIAVPEPAMWGLLVLSTAGVIFLLKKRQ